MRLEEWIEQEKTDSPDIADFLTKLTPYMSTAGFNASEFELKVGKGILQAELNIIESLKVATNANS